MVIKIFATGGTFDKIYGEIEEKLHFRDTHVHEMINVSRNSLPVEIETIMLIDSLYIKDEDRIKILEKCKSCNADRIIITHGTSTMIETAKLLAENIKDKTIILTGAMVPYSFGKSDASFNLGCALAFAQLTGHGIYITMNGKLFEWNNVRKNELTGKFEKIR